MTDPTTTPTPTESHQDVREEWAARLQCADVGVDFPWLTEDGCDVWHEQPVEAQEHYRNLLRVALSAGLQIPPAAAVSAAGPTPTNEQQDARFVDFVFSVSSQPPDDAWDEVADLIYHWAERHGLDVFGIASQRTTDDDGETFRTVKDALDAAEAERDAARAEVAALREQYRDLATYRTTHTNLGLCPEGSDDPARDPDCPVCAALAAAPSETEEGR